MKGMMIYVKANGVSASLENPAPRSNKNERAWAGRAPWGGKNVMNVSI